jgi:4-diphosphocytidyl-2-C-methyl-D-erythritol kinase
MHVVRDAAGVRVLAPAKINLFFEVLARRGDGFHEIETLMAPVDLFDELTFELDISGDLSLSCGWVERSPDERTYGTLPPAQDNLVLRAVALLRDRARVSFGARIRLLKRVPAAAGLGGGSSDAAAALLAANAVWKLDWPIDRLSKLAAELGSDVPFFLERCAATCRGRGEQVSPLHGLGDWHAVLVKPPIEHSTARVYAACRPAHEPRAVGACASALLRGDCRAVGSSCFNRLEAAAEINSPWIGRLRTDFSKLDCVCSQMSGSGSSYFGIFRSALHARRSAAQLRGRGEAKVFVVRVGAQRPAL